MHVPVVTWVLLYLSNSPTGLITWRPVKTKIAYKLLQQKISQLVLRAFKLQVAAYYLALHFMQV